MSLPLSNRKHVPAITACMESVEQHFVQAHLTTKITAQKSAKPWSMMNSRLEVHTHKNTHTKRIQGS